MTGHQRSLISPLCLAPATVPAIVAAAAGRGVTVLPGARAGSCTCSCDGPAVGCYARCGRSVCGVSVTPRLRCGPPHPGVSYMPDYAIFIT